jgi:parallel beta-helix repeat protein
MRTRLVVVALLASIMATASPVAAAAPPNPGDTRNCSDFADWAAANTWFWIYVGLYGDVAGLDPDGDLIACESLSGAPGSAQLPAVTQQSGYWMLEGDGRVYGFGDSYGIPPAVAADAVAIAAAPNRGYWVLTSDGRVHARMASHYGDVVLANLQPGEHVATIAGRPDGSGYWVFTNRGRAIPFGSATHHGDMTGTALNGPIVASAPTPSGNGYWMVGSDGGIFSFGDASFAGSTGAMVLNEPVVGIAPDPDGTGYWLVASDGGIFAFSAPFRGSLPGVLQGIRPNRPVIGALSYGNGYLMVASDGGIFSFSDLPFLGSLGDAPPAHPIVGVAAFSGSAPPPPPPPPPPPNPVTCPTATISVSTAAQLEAALDTADPGDTIRVADGTYSDNFVAERSGTAQAPIFLCGGPGAVLDGGSVTGGYVLHLDHVSHWRLVGFTARNGQKGVMLDGSSNNVIQGLTVEDIGDEAIHLRAASSSNSVIGNTVRRTGLRRDEFGEGIYVGSARSNWSVHSGGGPDRSDGNLVQGNVIGQTGAESIDIKEGTTGGQVLDNVMDGSGMTGADSVIDVKGNEWLIAGNLAAHGAKDGIQTHRILDGWGARNTIRTNTIGIDGTGVHVYVHDAAITQNVVACDNHDVGGGPATSNVACQ